MTFYAEPLPDVISGTVFVGQIGYEDRSSWYLREYHPDGPVAGFTFPYSRGGSFDSNLRRFQDAKAEIIAPVSLSEYRRELDEFLARSVTGDASLTIDISSMTRERLAATVISVRAILEDNGGYVDFVYSLANFTPPAVQSGALSAYPVLPDFRGALRRSSIPIGAIFGVGYEPKRAMGAHELLEPGESWVFSPEGTDPRFAEAVNSSNASLLALFPDDRRLGYPVLDPAATFASLESLVFSIREDHRLVLVPMGPKPFALASMLIGATRATWRPAVWRVGVRTHHDVVDVSAAGPVVGLRARWDPDLSS